MTNSVLRTEPIPNLKLLRAEIEALEHPVFAVLDGAQFDNLPDALFDGDFVHKPLYLDRGDGNLDQTVTAPQLVWLDRDTDTAPRHEDTPAPDVLDALFDLIDDKPAAVFWECPDGGDVLYKHLRTINMVVVPKEGRDFQSEQGSNQSSVIEDTHQQVLFRHADANVMAQVLPTLDERQFARLFKPATTILFVTDEDCAIGSPLMVAPRQDDLPQAPSGLLRLEAPQMRVMGNARIIRSHKRIADFLRKTAPVQTKKHE